MSDNQSKMVDWKRPLLIGIGWGLGTALGVVLFVGGFLWYQSRPKPPKPPKPWNTAAIKAEFDRVDTEGEDNNIVVSYTLENTTEFDYRVENGMNLILSARLEKEQSLAPFSKLTKIDFPIFIPARKRVRFPIRLPHPYSAEHKDVTDVADAEKHRQAVEKYMVDKLSNLNGFDLLDETNRYEIIFPAGWKHPKQ